FARSDETATAEPRRSLSIGDRAPALNIELWVHDKDKRLQPATRFEENKVYVVEFWATWCRPCIAMMPHLAHLQSEYGYDKLRIIGVTIEPKEVVEPFLERRVPGMEEKTYGELTSNYSLTADPDRSVYDDYMSASGVFVLPAAFVIGKSGFVEWIGHSTQIDQPLEAIVRGTWDRDAFADEFQLKQAALAAIQRISQLRNAQRDAPDKVLASLDKELEGFRHVNLPEVQLLRVLRSEERRVGKKW